MKYLVSLFLIIVMIHTHAKYKGDIRFTADEVRYHLKYAEKISQDASKCLERYLADHKDFRERYGFSRYYGSISKFSRLTQKERVAILEAQNVDASYVKELRPTSCIGLALSCLGEGFKNSKQNSSWKKINSFTRSNGSTGLALMYALRRIGWTSYYWNPDSGLNAQWDQEEKELYPNNENWYWGHHQTRYKQATSHKKYYFNIVDDATSLVDFKDVLPPVLEQASFFISVAHNGYHVVPGSLGKTIEAHGLAEFNKDNVIEKKNFNPLAENELRSGLIIIPPQKNQVGRATIVDKDLAPTTSLRPQISSKPRKKPRKNPFAFLFKKKR